jgi:hypothetical protein
MTLTARATRAQIEQAFDLHIHDYKLGAQKFYANDRDPGLPVEFAPAVQAVQGLSDFARPRRAFLRVAFAKAICPLTSQISLEITDACTAIEHELERYKTCLTDAGVSYPVPNDGFEASLQKQLAELRRNNCKSSSPITLLPSLAASKLDGTGQKVGLLEFDSFNPSDVQNFLDLIGYSSTVAGNLSEMKVNGGAAIGGYEDEVLLDTDAVLTIAPGAKVVVYDSPFTAPGASFQALLNTMINDGDTVISNSWLYCENQTNAADVNSIDSILATAAASGITVLNASGDTGAVCGAGKSAGVPADSPHATAVGGTTAALAPGYVYGSEGWWDTVNATPPGGQGGFGTSAFFSSPPYQSGLNPSAMRSVPDLVILADPTEGVQICQADSGGCPTGQLYGGTSNSAPVMAAMVAQINQYLGHNLGELNPLIYPLAKTKAFRSATALSSDFAHVGLGSPNIDALALGLAGQSPGTVDASQSLVGTAPLGPGDTPAYAPADGSTQVYVIVNLLDANDHSVSGKSVSLSASPGTTAKISPASAVSDSYGSSVFTVTDLMPEKVTLTATDTSDSIKLTQTETVNFLVPPAAGAGVDVLPSSVTADGFSTATLTITLKDAMGRPTPGKLINISQGTGHSVIAGPTPSVTDSNGQLQFAVSNFQQETVTYSVVDITDGNLPFPSTAQVTFSNGPNPGCANGNPGAAPGYLVSPFASGFLTENFGYGGISFGFCQGAVGTAFDKAGNLYVGDLLNGNIYKFGPAGGVASDATLLTKTALGPTLTALAFGLDGNLYAARAATTGDITTGAIFQVDTSTGDIVRTVATGLHCPYFMATDPLSGDLFVDSSCGGPDPALNSLWRVNPTTGKVTVYGNLPTQGNGQITFAPDGTMYIVTSAQVERVAGTDTPQPATFTSLPIVPWYGGLLAAGQQANGDAQFLFIAIPGISNSGGLGTVDLTANPPSAASTLVNSFNHLAGAETLQPGPDGCVYGSRGDAVFRITDDQGGCSFTSFGKTISPSLSLTPVVTAAQQGGQTSFTAMLHYTAISAGTPVLFHVSGANPQTKLVRTDDSGSANVTYTGVHAGADTIYASAALGSTTLLSNQAQMTWSNGAHTTFLTLNLSPDSAPVGKAVTMTASLADTSVTPPSAVPGANISFQLEGQSCNAATDLHGTASCSITPPFAATATLSANFPGSGSLLAAQANVGFNVTAPPTLVPTFTPKPTATPTPSARPTASFMPTATPSLRPTASPTSAKLTPTPTAPICIGSTPGPTVPAPTPTPPPGNPRIASISNPVLVGASFTIKGSNFTAGSMVNFFVATAAGPNECRPAQANCRQHVHPTDCASSRHSQRRAGVRIGAGGEYGSRLCFV